MSRLYILARSVFSPRLADWASAPAVSSDIMVGVGVPAIRQLASPRLKETTG
jgi:hypothetical protein